MARPKLKAEFFVSPEGTVSLKARPLNSGQRLEIFNRDGRICQICARPVKFCRIQIKFLDDAALGHIDHIIPRARGGQNDPENLRLLCEYCNTSIGANI
jgi:5-methylcytosine-specific restriction endonuclease McrA